MPDHYSEKGKQAVKEYKRLSAIRYPYETIWEDAYEFSYPLRGQRFVRRDDNPVSTAWNYENDRALLFDTTGKDSCRLLASSILSGLTPPNMQWFHLGVPELSYEEVPLDARQWLDFSSRKLFKEIHASNYDAEGFEFMLDMVVAGMAGLYIDWVEGEGFDFEMWPLETMFVEERLKKGRIDTVYRRIIMRPPQMVNKFGLKNVPQSVAQQYHDPSNRGSSYGEAGGDVVIHVIRPRMKGNKQATGKRQKTMPWESLWVHEKSGQIMLESGFMEFPVVIPRWRKIPESDYAIGPFDDALPDVKTLNQVVRLMLTHADMAIAGMWVAKDDGVINPNSIKVGPRKFFFAADPNNIKPLTSPGDFSIATAEMQRLQTNIRRVMMSDQLQPTDGPAMTATEVHVRTQLVRQLLGPIYGRFQAEFLQPLIERTFGLAYRAGILGQAPESLVGVDFIPEYTSPLARAQKQEDVTAMTQYEMALGQQAQIKPEVLDLYKWDDAARRRGDLLGIPVELLRDEREVKALREERRKQIEQERMMEMAAAQEQEQ